MAGPSASSMSKFEKQFEEKLDTIEQMLMLQPLLAYPEGCAELRNFQTKVQELKNILEMLKSAITAGQEEVNTLKRNHENLSDFKDKIDDILVYSVKHSTTRQEVSPEPSTKHATDNKENAFVPMVGRHKNTPQLNPVKSPQFTKVPRHIRGHLTIEQMNAGVHEVNEILKGKYGFLSRPRKALSLKEDKRRAVYVEQAKEVKGTAHATFFVDEDIQIYGKMLKLKRKTKDNVFLVLRHLGIIKEIHKGKLTRYAILKC